MSVEILTIGLPVIDESLDGLLDAMKEAPTGGMYGTMVAWAKSVGLCLALCVGSYESWMMMLGRRGMDVMKLLRVAGVSLCISLSGQIASALSVPGESLAQAARGMARSMNAQVATKEAEVADLQAEYIERLRAVQDSVATAKEIAAIGEDASWWEELSYNIGQLGNRMNDFAKRAAAAVESKISEWINDLVRFVCELVFQMGYYAVLVGQSVFTAILALFCPVSFALSLAPPFRSAWSQWMSKYLSLSLWGFVAYMILYYVDYILLYDLEQDCTAYRALINRTTGAWSEVGTLGLQGIGSNCMYAMGLLVGAALLSFVPEVASWLVPGGVSSGWGGASAGAVNAKAATAAAAAPAATKSAAVGTYRHAAVPAARGAASVAADTWRYGAAVARNVGRTGNPRWGDAFRNKPLSSPPETSPPRNQGRTKA